MTTSTLAPTDEELRMLRYAAANDQINIIKDFFNKFGTSRIDDTGSLGWTLLMYAACSGSPPTLSFLLEHGASLTVKSTSGKDALGIAIHNKNQDNITFLEKYIEQERRKKAAEKKRIADSFDARINQLKQKRPHSPFKR